MKLYLSGPMRGLKKFNFPAFEVAAKALRLMGHDVASPAEHDLETSPHIVYEDGYEQGDPAKTRLFDSRVAFKWDFQQIIDAHGIAMMPGWEKSSGARAERLVAELTGKLVLILTVDHSKPYDFDLVPDVKQDRMLTKVES